MSSIVSGSTLYLYDIAMLLHAVVVYPFLLLYSTSLQDYVVIHPCHYLWMRDVISSSRIFQKRFDMNILVHNFMVCCCYC